MGYGLWAYGLWVMGLWGYGPWAMGHPLVREGLFFFERNTPSGLARLTATGTSKNAQSNGLDAQWVGLVAETSPNKTKIGVPPFFYNRLPLGRQQILGRA